MAPPRTALRDLLDAHPIFERLIQTIDGLPFDLETMRERPFGSSARIEHACGSTSCERNAPTKPRTLADVKRAADRNPKLAGYCRSCATRVGAAKRPAPTLWPIEEHLQPTPFLLARYVPEGRPRPALFDRRRKEQSKTGTKARVWWKPKPGCPQCAFDGGYACSVEVRRRAGEVEWCPHDRVPTEETSAHARIVAVGLYDTVLSSPGVPADRLEEYLRSVLPGRTTVRWRCPNTQCGATWRAKVRKRLGLGTDGYLNKIGERRGSQCPECSREGRRIVPAHRRLDTKLKPVALAAVKGATPDIDFTHLSKSSNVKLAVQCYHCKTIFARLVHDIRRRVTGVFCPSCTRLNRTSAIEIAIRHELAACFGLLPNGCIPEPIPFEAADQMPRAKVAAWDIVLRGPDLPWGEHVVLIDFDSLKYHAGDAGTTRDTRKLAGTQRALPLAWPIKVREGLPPIGPNDVEVVVGTTERQVVLAILQRLSEAWPATQPILEAYHAHGRPLATEGAQREIARLAAVQESVAKLTRDRGAPISPVTEPVPAQKPRTFRQRPIGWEQTSLF